MNSGGSDPLHSPDLDDDEIVNAYDDATDLPLAVSPPALSSPSDGGEAALDPTSQPVDITVESRAHGWRLDHYLSRLFPNHSRAQIQRAIAGELVSLNGLPVKASRRLRVNDRIHMRLLAAEQGTVAPENIPLDVIYEDDSLVVVNKSAHMVVHPGRGNYSGTLAGALQFHFDSLSSVAGMHRPGIVHRLDRDTSGVILIAKDNQVHQKISGQFERREVRKEYRAIVRGIPELDSDHIRTFVCVHPRTREKMMVCPEGGNAREATTFYRIGEHLGHYALMELHPRTGRTHQLRIHMQHIGTPIVADSMYGGHSRFSKRDLLPETSEAEDQVLISRQALHAFRLTIRHPVTEQEIQFEAPLPEDFQRTLDFMRSHC